MKDIKIRVHNPEHSEAIQKRLFKLGCGWSSWDGLNKGQPIHLDAKFLFAYANFNISKSKNEDWFLAHKNKEVTLDDLYKMDYGIKVKLNDELEAEILDGFIQVGCQKIEFKKVKELYKAIKTLVR